MPKRILTGTVTSDANEQTVTVSVERKVKTSPSGSRITCVTGHRSIGTG